MNRNVKRILSAVLAVMLLASCFSLAALADGSTTPSMTSSSGHTLTVKNTSQSGHTYNLYQIFSGLWEEKDGKGTLSNVEWGISVKKLENGATKYDLSTALVAALLDGTDDDLHNIFKEELMKKAPETKAGETEGSTVDTTDEEKIAWAKANATAADIAGVLSRTETADTTPSIASAECLDAFAQIVYNLITEHNEADAKDNSGNNQIEVRTDGVSSSEKDTLNNTTVHTYTFNNVADGYYMLTEGTYTPAKDDNGNDIPASNTRFILQVIDDATVSPKTQGNPDINKTIASAADDTNAADNTTRKDVSVGDTVYFDLRGNVPEMKYYNAYYYIVNDTLSKGLTFDKINSVSVGDVTLVNATDITAEKDTTAKIDDDGVLILKDGTKTENYFTYSTTTTGNGETALKIVFHKFIQYESQVTKNVIINYSAVLNSDANIGTAGNPNEVSLTYSNNPNYNYDGKKDEPDTNVPTGESGKSIVYVYTTAIRILKVNDTNKVLEGAVFQITGDGVNNVITVSEKFVTKSYLGDYAVAGYSSTNTKYYELPDGTFSTTAPVTEAEGNTESSYVTEAVRFNDDGTVNPAGEYVKTTSGKLVKASDWTEADGDKVTAIAIKEKETVTEVLVGKGENKVDVVGTTNDEGLLVFRGLSAGTYTITELKAPTGYNLLKAPINITITFENNGTAGSFSYNSSDSNVSHDRLDDGTIRLTIQNVAGSTLPSTGGIGTTIFYVVGSIMVLCAAVMLITMRRMRKENN
jgi:fimbrial isopeptide formation D2 family protein/LPXTG-motif cell wall-anchored protein